MPIPPLHYTPTLAHSRMVVDSALLIFLPSLCLSQSSGAADACEVVSMQVMTPKVVRTDLNTPTDTKMYILFYLVSRHMRWCWLRQSGFLHNLVQHRSNPANKNVGSVDDCQSIALNI